MVFSSFTFILAFLPITVICYFVARKELKNIVLLIASLIFYAWGEPIYVFLMITSIIVNYFFAILIEKKSLKNLYFVLVIIFNIAVIGFFKYGNFIILNLNRFFDLDIAKLNLALPIGISFYTFQALSYIIDVWKGESRAQKNILNVGLYISLFPQLIAGPIVKYEDIKNQLDPDMRSIKLYDMDYGFRRFVIGFSKKVILANSMGFVADAIFKLSPGYAGGTLIWLGTVCYTLQIYFDFSGYSDMAIGLGRIFGFKFMENFNYPYISSSISEFWRRWHISLSTWFREFVYIPLGGNKVSPIRWIFNTLIVWILTGMWHGAAWNFIVWGLLYGVLLIIERFYFNLASLKYKNGLKQGNNKAGILFRIFGHLYTLFIILFTFIIFRVEGGIANISETIQHLFSKGDVSPLAWIFSSSDLTISLLFLPLAIFGCLPLFKRFMDYLFNKNLPFRVLIYLYHIAIFYISIIMLLGATFNPFIYFRF
ncbi:MAG: MBOAT family protein [Clostridiales Family XIII bacterium]|jgi:alginate O-acetyltransferase complex protein AlgI|nr:MBOAT family protein [Clostridiales Family XIII bacterium]